VFDTPPFAVADIVKMAARLDNSFRLVDTDSGGDANNDHIGDVNDVHDYPNPGNPIPSSKQYAMVGEFGGIGAFVAGNTTTRNVVLLIPSSRIRLVKQPVLDLSFSVSGSLALPRSATWCMR
jgi:hypothetical protein